MAHILSKLTRHCSPLFISLHYTRSAAQAKGSLKFFVSFRLLVSPCSLPHLQSTYVSWSLQYFSWIANEQIFQFFSPQNWRWFSSTEIKDTKFEILDSVNLFIIVVNSISTDPSNVESLPRKEAIQTSDFNQHFHEKFELVISKFEVHFVKWKHGPQLIGAWQRASS